MLTIQAKHALQSLQVYICNRLLGLSLLTSMRELLLPDKEVTGRIDLLHNPSNILHSSRIFTYYAASTST